MPSIHVLLVYKSNPVHTLVINAPFSSSQIWLRKLLRPSLTHLYLTSRLMAYKTQRRTEPLTENQVHTEPSP